MMKDDAPYFVARVVFGKRGDDPAVDVALYDSRKDALAAFGHAISESAHDCGIDQGDIISK